MMSRAAGEFFCQAARYKHGGEMHHKRHFILLLILLTLPGLSEGCTSSTATEYRNTDYGFSFSLPKTWKGYSTRIQEWQGFTAGSQGDTVVEQGPMISIVHPDSTPQQPYQDIPILIFTIQQWNHLQQGKWHIGAAPINPSELARNEHYVFALPARYNYASLQSWDEVESILECHPIQTFEPTLTSP